MFNGKLVKLPYFCPLSIFVNEGNCDCHFRAPVRLEFTRDMVAYFYVLKLNLMCPEYNKGTKTKNADTCQTQPS